VGELNREITEQGDFKTIHVESVRTILSFLSHSFISPRILLTKLHFFASGLEGKVRP
jgi:hypothetical protein